MNYQIEAQRVHGEGVAREAQEIKISTVIQTAINSVHGPRQDDYGSPLGTHTRIARHWSVILGYRVAPIQVAQCMIAVKLSRLNETPDHHDSWADIAGYAEVAGLMLEDNKTIATGQEK